MTRPIRIFPLGACRMRAPMQTVLDRGSEAGGDADRKITFARVCHGAVPRVYTFGEMFQLVQRLKGTGRLPPILRPLAEPLDPLRPFRQPKGLNDTDFILVELNTPFELSLRRYYLNRYSVQERILTPLMKVSREVKKLASSWLNNGVLGGNSELQAQTAEALIQVMPPQMPDHPEIIKRVLRELRGHRRDIREGLEELRALTDYRPMGVLVYIFQYMPDGRVITWPERFREDVIDAAGQLGLPIFDPSPLVVDYGVPKAMMDDLGHYSEEFLPVIGEALADFAVAASSSARRFAAE